MTASLTALMNALGWTLLRSFWQAFIVFIVLRLLLMLFRHAPARARYYLSCGAMAAIFLGFILTFYRQWPSGREAAAMLPALPAAFPPAAPFPLPLPGRATPGFLSLYSLLPWLDVLYIAGLLAFAGRMTRDVLALSRIRKSRVHPFDAAWEKYLDKLSAGWQVTRRVGLYLSELIDVPVVIGFLKPVIYLPLSIANNLTPEQIEAILLHELAHVRRYDFLINILQTAVEVILFFNPFVWWISKNIRAEREHCCDDLVLSATHPKLYAEALLALEENRLYKGRFVLAAGDKKQVLFKRVKRMMEMKTRKLNPVQKLLTLLVLAGCVFSVAWLAPEKKEAPARVKLQAAVAHRLTMINDRPALAQKTVPPAPVVLPSPPAGYPLPADTVPARQDGNTSGRKDRPGAIPGTARAEENNARPDDSAVQHMQEYLQQWEKYRQHMQEYARQMNMYMNSPRWKQQVEDMKQQAMKMKEKMTSDPAWRQQVEDMQQQAMKMKEKMMSDPAWRQQVEDMKQQAMKMKEKMTSDPAWRQQVEDMKRQAMKMKEQLTSAAWRQHIDSMRALVGRQIALAGGNRALALADGRGHTVNSNRLTAMLVRDGLLRDDRNYRIRLNDKGLYINGKKQARTYFEKYRRLVGKHTDLEIKKKNNRIQIEGTIGKQDSGNNNSTDL